MMTGHMAFPEHARPNVEPGTVIAGKYVLLRANPSDVRSSWLARDTEQDVLRALHLMEPAAGESARSAFEREMREASQLVHPQLVPIVDYGWDNSGFLFTAEERVDARTLTEWLDTESMTPVRGVELVAQLLRVLAWVHSAGVAHADLQPKHLLIRRSLEQPHLEQLLIRGLGRARFSPFHVTQPAVGPGRISVEWIVGCPEYASPEQLCGEPHDARSDLYAVGLLLFRVLTGCSPFAATRPLDLAWMHRFTLPPPPSMYVEMSTALETVCLKALSKTPELRFQSAAEMLAALLSAHPALPPPPVAQSASLFGMRTRPGAPPQAMLAGRPSPHSAVPALPAPRLSRGSMLAAIDRRPRPHARERRDWGLPLAIAVFTFALTMVALIAAPRIGDWLHPRVGEPATHVASAAESASRASSRAPIATIAIEPEPDPTPSIERTRPIESERPVEDFADTAVPTRAHDEDAPSAAVIEPHVSVVAGGKRAARLESHTPPTRPVVQVAPRGTPNGPTPNRAPAGDSAYAMRTYHPTSEIAPRVDGLGPPAATARARPTPAAASSTPPGQVPVRPVPAAPTGGAARATAVRVVIGRARNVRGAVPRGSLRDALNVASLERCYRLALEGRAGPAALLTELEVETEMSGRISSARLRGRAVPPKLVACVEDSVRFGRVRDADTGNLHATVELVFENR